MLECTKAFLKEDLEHPHLVVLGVDNQHQLLKAARKLDIAGIQYRMFIEPDRNNEPTAIATQIISGDQRHLFKNYRCLGSPVQKEAI